LEVNSFLAENAASRKRSRKTARTRLTRKKAASRQRVKKEPQTILEIKGASTSETGPMLHVTLGGAEKGHGKRGADLHFYLGSRQSDKHEGRAASGPEK